MTGKTLEITMDQMELACRIAEAVMGIPRPVGASAKAAMSEFDDDIHAGFQRAAISAMRYFNECINQTNKTQLIPPGGMN
jgi:hypothetical protein